MMNEMLAVKLHPVPDGEECYPGDMIGAVPMILRLKNFLAGNGKWFIFIGYRSLNDIKKSKWEFQRNGRMITVTEIYGTFKSDEYHINQSVARKMYNSLRLALTKCQLDIKNTSCVV